MQPNTIYRAEGRILWQRKKAGGCVCGVEFADADEGKRCALKKCFEFFCKNPEF